MTIFYHTDLHLFQEQSDKLLSIGNATWANHFSYDNSIRAIIVPASCLIDHSVTDLYPNLKYIASNTTSCPHISPESKARYEIISLEGHPILESITSTAEHTLGLIMALHRRIPAAQKAVERGEWNRYEWGAPKMLSDMTLGIIGAGRVGSHLARITGNIFSLIYEFDVEDYKNKYKWIEACNVIAICASVREADTNNQPIISRDVLSRMRPDVLLVNTARAVLLDHEALFRVLISKKIRGAALDMLPGEYNPKRNSISQELIRYASENSNLIITPHIAGSTQDAWRMTLDAVIDMLLDRIQEDAGN